MEDELVPTMEPSMQIPPAVGADSTPEDDTSIAPVSNNAAESSTAARSRKRTKTGCLTCRRRRIKCGEERPICKNCIKSKRSCEGYNPRTIYTEPGSDARNHLGESFQHELESPLYPMSAGSQSAFDPSILPFSSQPSHPDHLNSNFAPTHVQDPQQFVPLPSTQYGDSMRADLGPVSATSYQSSSDASLMMNHTPSPYTVQSRFAAPSVSAGPGNLTSPGFSPYGDQYPPVGSNVTAILDQQFSPIQTIHPTQQPLPVFDPTSHFGPATLSSTTFQDDRRDARQHGPGTSAIRSASADARHEPETDDDMDLEMTALESASVHATLPRNVGLQIAVTATQRPRGLRAPVLAGSGTSIAEYRPSPSASPLMNPETARVFCHFVTVTGPLLSIQERLVPNPSLLFSRTPVPKNQQCVWTYTLPMLALKSPALLQAILAVSCLHIAKLKGESILPSLKHYHMALRRVARCVGVPSRRNGIDVLAATLLLGYYEIGSQEHNKWNSHLLGARQLLVETDFLSMTKRLHRMKRNKDEHSVFPQVPGYSSLPPEAQIKISKHLEEIYLGSKRDVDEGFLSQMTGQLPRYSQTGLTEYETASTPEDIAAKGYMTPREIDDYDLRCDLYWWYLKQDVIQSLISSNSLLLDYDKWTNVPPRAPVNRIDAVYGTYDHLVLLMGRLANFAAKDLGRKRRAEAANGGAWKPPPGMDMRSMRPPGAAGKSGPPTMPTGMSAPPGQPPSLEMMQKMMQMQGPPMTGMIPAPPAAQMPRGFMTEEGASPASTQDDQDFEVATSQAENEWVSIKEALASFKSALGPEFDPLPADARPPTATPFGPALHYANPSITLVWQWYHMALIIHQRVHPSMPPASMVAAGIAAGKTGHSANEIGRISAGVDFPSAGFKDLVSDSAAIDIALGLFFASVQYQDAAQRGWTVSKLIQSVERIGWGAGELIASGCERAWEKAAEMGRGPPYIRTMNPWAKDDRVAGRPFDPSNPIIDDNDRRNMRNNPGARVHWALGVLGLENGIQNLRV